MLLIVQSTYNINKVSDQPQTQPDRQANKTNAAMTEMVAPPTPTTINILLFYFVQTSCWKCDDIYS